MKLWALEHFRILPTDNRYKELSLDQIELLFINFLRTPSEEDHKKIYADIQKKEDIVDSMPRDVLKEMNYTDEDINQIAEEVRKVAF